MIKCNICKSNSQKIFVKNILSKYEVNYYKCENCGFIQTDKPFWLNEAYNNAITSLDIGLIARNLQLKNDVSKIIDYCFGDAMSFLDYAGGYGMFTRLMRDIGYDFYHEDQYCENIFAKYFDEKDNDVKYYDLITAFEVLEHLENPVEELKEIFKKGENFVFTTELVPKNFNENWIYLAPETGQHISFYTTESLKYLANKFGYNYYNKNNFIHIFTKRLLTQEYLDFKVYEKRKKYFGLITKYKLKEIKNNRTSFCHSDYLHIKNIITNK